MGPFPGINTGQNVTKHIVNGRLWGPGSWEGAIDALANVNKV